MFDYNGDGKDDLFIIGNPGNGSAWQIHPSQGRVNHAFNTNVNLIGPTAFIPADYQWLSRPMLTDVNGDGQLDAIFNNGTTLKIFVSNRGAQGTYGWGPEPLTVVSSQLPSEKDCGGSTCYLSKVELAQPNGSYQLLDFDGDSRSDLMLNAQYTTPDPGCGMGTAGRGESAELPSLPTQEDGRFDPGNGCYPTKDWFGYVMSVVSQTSNTLNIEPYGGAPRSTIGKFADFNGDGLTDVLSGDAVSFNTGAGFATPVTVGPFPHPNKVHAVDVTGDGRADVVYMDNTGSGWRYYVRASRPDNSFAAATLVPGEGAFACVDAGCDPANYLNSFTDLDSDGALDYFAFHMSDNPVYYVSQSSPADRGRPRDVIVAIQNGLGARTEVSYASVTNAAIHRRDPAVPTRNWGRDAPVQDFNAPMYVVSKASSSAPTIANPAAMATLHYRYAGAKVQTGGRGFLGFREIVTIDPNHASGYISTTTEYRQDFPFTGMPVRTVKRADTGMVYIAPGCLSTPTANECYDAYRTPWPQMAGA